MRIAVCDDDSGFLELISSILKAWADRRPDLTTEYFTDGDTLIGAHAGDAFDVILLDVMMPILNGIEVAREIRRRDKEVRLVFLTSSVDYAVDSYSVKASNYLLKPVDPAKLICCLEELEADIFSSATTIAVKGVREVHRVSVSSIEYLEGRGKHAVLVLSGGDVIQSNEPLYAFEDRLFIDDGFYKCHRSYIVNINHIARYTSDTAVMRGGTRIPIARGCRAEFKEAYFSVLFGKAGDEAW